MHRTTLPKREPGWLWTGGQAVSLPAPSVRSGRASRELPVSPNKVAGQIWKTPQPGAVTRQPARRREPRTRSPRGRAAHARWPSARLSGFGSPTAGREERACAKAPLGFSEQPGSRSRLGYLLAFKTEPFLGYAGRLPTLLTSSGQKRPEERASITRATSQSGARAPDRAGGRGAGPRGWAVENGGRG